jgi:hypothetical protein
MPPLNLYQGQGAFCASVLNHLSFWAMPQRWVASRFWAMLQRLIAFHLLCTMDMWCQWEAFHEAFLIRVSSIMRCLKKDGPDQGPILHKGTDICQGFRPFQELLSHLIDFGECLSVSSRFGFHPCRLHHLVAQRCQRK